MSELTALKQERATKVQDRNKDAGHRRPSEETTYERGSSKQQKEAGARIAAYKSGADSKAHDQVSADGKKVDTQKGPEFETVKPRANEKSAVAKARAKNNATRDGSTRLGKGLPAEVTIGK